MLASLGQSLLLEWGLTGIQPTRKKHRVKGRGANSLKTRMGFGLQQAYIQ